MSIVMQEVTKFQEGDAMIEVQSTRDRPALTASQCVICGKSVRINPSKYAVKVVCKACRCTHCGIPISFEICRCSESHGRPSRMPGLCERCYAVTHPLVPAVLVDDAVALEYVSLPSFDEQGIPRPDRHSPNQSTYSLTSQTGNQYE